jgi:glycosyltransferase involved in cell wall biosynthesis
MTPIINVLRPGAFGDVVMTSCVTAEFKRRGFDVHYYTEAVELATLLDGVDVVKRSAEWPNRLKGRDYVASFSGQSQPQRYCLDIVCESAGLPCGGRMGLRSFPKPLPYRYVTLQRKAGWSSLKDYPHWDKVINDLSLPVVELDASRPWSETCALIQHASLHLGIDSVCSHIAAAYGTRAVVVFGSTPANVFGHLTATNLSEGPAQCHPCFIEDNYTNGHRYGEKCHIGGCAQFVQPEKIVKLSNNMINTKISLLHATRGRPKLAVESRNAWLGSAINPEAVEHIFAIDADDKDSEVLKEFTHVIQDDIDGGCVGAWNVAAKTCTGDILVSMCDDFSPPDGWDKLFIDAFAGTSGPAVLRVNDGYRTDELLCVVIINRARYQQQGYFLHPNFKSVVSDYYHSWCAYRDGIVIDARHITVVHHHPFFEGGKGWDAVYAKQNSRERQRNGAVVFEELIRSRGVKLSVCMIVKNEEACIAASLESVKGADEVIVLDTGSTDNTAEVVASLNQPNVRFIKGVYQWKDNFADARNTALKYCAGEWVLIIDADETLTDGGMAKLRAAIAKAKGKTLFLNTHGSSSTAVHRSIRAFRRGVKYVGAAHEVPDANDGEECDAEVVYGYSPAHDLDPDRMLRILTKVYAQESPKNSRTIYYLAREHWYRKQYAEAEKLFLEHVKCSNFLAERADAYLYLARIYWTTTRGDAARDACMKAITINANFKEALLFMATLSFEHNAVTWRKFAECATNERVLFVRV